MMGMLWKSSLNVAHLYVCRSVQKHFRMIVKKIIIDSSSVPEGKLMGVELIGVYKSGSINWG